MKKSNELLKPKNSRLIALNWLLQVIQKGRSVNAVLANSKQTLTPQQQALAKQLMFGCLRYFHQLKTIAENLLDKPFKNKDTDLLVILIIGLYQLKYLSTPDHAAISESVELTRDIRKKWAAGLVNGVLRRFQRESSEIQVKLEKSVQFQYSHPGWMVKKLKHDWPDHFEDILLNNNHQASMTLRVNTLKNSITDYLEKLKQADLVAKKHTIAPDAIVLEQAVDVGRLPGFELGEVSIQDGAAQLVVEMLDLKPGQRVLDACAAPGGKTTHILQRQKQVNLTAVEMSAQRAEKILETLQRLQLQCEVLVSDINDIESWWDGDLFDRILLDVPCSASGVIRRNPDIKIHRKVTDIDPLLEIQSQILKQAWQLLKPGGILVYATCSVYKAENIEQIEAFLSSQKAELITLPESINQLLCQTNQRFSEQSMMGYQILPGDAEMDGFYFCGLKKLNVS